MRQEIFSGLKRVFAKEIDSKGCLTKIDLTRLDRSAVECLVNGMAATHTKRVTTYKQLGKPAERVQVKSEHHVTPSPFSFLWHLYHEQCRYHHVRYT